MGKENGLLLATGKGIYYEGVPSSATYTTSAEKNSTIAITSENSKNDEIVNKIYAGMDIVGSIFTNLAVVFVIIGFFITMKSGSNKDESDEELFNAENEKVIQSSGPSVKTTIILYVAALALYSCSEVFEIIKEIMETLL